MSLGRLEIPVNLKVEAISLIERAWQIMIDEATDESKVAKEEVITVAERMIQRLKTL